MSEQAKLVTLSPARPDQEIADDIRKRLAISMASALKIMDEARSSGLMVAFQIAPDQFGRSALQAVTITKPL